VTGVPGTLSRIKLVDAALVIIVVVAFGWFLIFVDRGLDITDEGMYLLSARYPRDIWAATTDYHFYLAWLYRVSGQSVVGLRLCGVVLLVGASAVAAAGMEAVLRKEDGGRERVVSVLGLGAFLTLGALLYYSWAGVTPGYNLLTSVAAYVTMGLLWLGLGRDAETPPAPIRQMACFFGVGVAAGFAFFVKFPAGIVLAGLSSIAVLIWPLRQGTRPRALAAMVLGFACWVAIHFVAASSPAEWWRRFHLGVELTVLLNSAYRPSIALYNYAYRGYEILRWQVLANLWPAFVWLMVALAAVVFSERRTHNAPRGRRLGMAAVASAFAWILWRIFTLGWHWGGSNSVLTLLAPYVALSLAMGLVLLGLVMGSRGAGQRAARLGARAVAVTLMVAVGFTIGPPLGTNNPIDANIMMTMAPLFAGFLFAVELAGRYRLPRWLGGSLVVSLAVLAVVQITTAPIRSPYRLNTGILAQTEKVELGGASDHLKVDTATAAFLRHASSALAGCGFKPGEDLIALVGIPGLVYAFGGRSPVVPWYYPYGCISPGAKVFNERMLAQIDARRLHEAFLLLTPSRTEGLPDLAKLGIELGRDYALCNEVTWPVTGEAVQIWKGSAAAR
jgi:hypothetical protein